MISRAWLAAAAAFLSVDFASAMTSVRCETGRTNSADAPLSVLLCSRKRGDRKAAYELGRRYALGIGVARDARRSVSYLRQAAARKVGTTFIYSPPVGKEAYV